MESIYSPDPSYQNRSIDLPRSNNMGENSDSPPVQPLNVGNGQQKKGWFGWAENAKIEKLKDDFVRAASLDDQKKIATEIQKEAYDQVIYVPLGQYLAPSAWRKSLTGVLDGPATPVFWNIEKK